VKEFDIVSVDASKAGSGNIEIMINGGEIACSVQNHGNYKFTASFLPANLDDHKIEMKFNSEQVPGKLFYWFISLVMWSFYMVCKVYMVCQVFLMI
jgi:hypothetical protein